MKTVNSKLRIVVLGYLVRGPLGGLVWHHLQYILGLLQSGHDAIFLEDSGDDPYCYDPSCDEISTDPTYGLKYVADLFDVFASDGLHQRWAWYDATSKSWHGPFAPYVLDFCKTADLVINLSAVNPLRDWLLEIPIRALVDTDPVFTQIRHLTESEPLSLAKDHNRFFTFGTNIGTDLCRIPDDGFPWVATRQPIVLNCWNPAMVPGPADGPFTTVMQWDSYSRRQWNGILYGMKSDSFGPYIDLPTLVSERLELAMGGGSEVRSQLMENGWSLKNPLRLLPSPFDYCQYLSRSKGEFSVAKHGYACSKSGWFSERSAAYLASGRPVITQDTGFSSWLPVGEGLMAFQNPKDAVLSLEAVSSRYESHCRAARHLASAYFSASLVLAELIDAAMG